MIGILRSIKEARNQEVVHSEFRRQETQLDSPQETVLSNISSSTTTTQYPNLEESDIRNFRAKQSSAEIYWNIGVDLLKEFCENKLSRYFIQNQVFVFKQ